MMKKMMMAFAALAAIEAGAITATKEYVDRKDAEIRTNTYTRAETDARIPELAPRTDLTPATNYTDEVAGRTQQSAGEYTDGRINDLKVELMQEIGTIPRMSTNDVCNIVTNEVSEWKYSADYEIVYPPRFYEREWEMAISYNGITFYGNAYVGPDVDEIEFSMGPTHDTATDDYYNPPVSKIIATSITRNALGLARLSDLPPLTNGLIGADFISTNNAAFVSAVTNCPVAIAAGDAEALAEWGIYGGGGTIGALLAALAAAVVALRKKKMPLYPVGGSGNPVNATLESGVLTVSPFSMAAYTPTASAAFSVAMGALPSDMESGKARDAVLVIDCTSLTDGQEPTVTWDTHFHPRTDTATDFACVAGAKNVYYISEYATGEFAVGGWTETEGGYTPNAQSGGSGT